MSPGRQIYSKPDTWGTGFWMSVDPASYSSPQALVEFSATEDFSSLVAENPPGPVRWLARDGRWLVPPQERPSGWSRYGLLDLAAATELH